MPETQDDRGDIERLRERLLLDPRDDGAMCALAGLLEAAGDLPGAIDLLQRALRVDPYRISALLDLGRLWNHLGRYRAGAVVVHTRTVDRPGLH